jgi:hypothetical protein
MRELDSLFDKLARSAFRSRFRLSGRELEYARTRTMPVLLQHARDLLGQRLFVAAPLRDGRQTPFRGHPVFIAQHATGTCCRGCLAKWHGIEKGAALSVEEEEYVLSVIAYWLERQLSS